jgi:hypothetical protein
MKLYNLFIVLILCVIILNDTPAQLKTTILYTDDFSVYLDGSDGSPTWHPIRGTWQMIQKKYIQQSPDYDCASLLDIFSDESFEIEAQFEQIDGDLGAGFIFSSRSLENIEFAQLVRFDGNGIILSGYYQNGEFNATSSGMAPSISPTTIHKLVLRIDREIDEYSVFLDNKVILSNCILRYPAGYIGLQSSGGSVKYHEIIIRQLRNNGKTPSFPWIKHFAFLPNGGIAVPNERKGVVNVYDKQGNILRTIGSPVSSKGQLHQPNAIALHNDTTLLVTDCGNNRLQQFSISGQWMGSVGWQGNGLGQFHNPVALAVNAERKIFVVDRDNNRIQVFDPNLKPLVEFGNNRLKEPGDIAFHDSTIYVLNTGLCQIESYTWTGTKAIWNTSIGYGGGEGHGLAVVHDTLYVSVVNEVRAYDTAGTLLHLFRARCSNFILPQAIVPGNDNQLYIADYFFGRIISTTHDLMDPTPTITYPDPTTATIEWNSLAKQYGTVSYGPRFQFSTAEIKDNNQNATISIHKVILRDLVPGVIVPIRMNTPLNIIPERLTPSRFPHYTITPPTKIKSKLYARLPMATLIFSNIVGENANSLLNNTPEAITDTELNRIKDQINDGIRFYWIHSGMRFFIDNEFIVINEPLRRSQLYGNEWWYPPKDSMLAYFLKRHGKDIKDYSGFLYLTCTQNYDSTEHKYFLSGKGGAFTNGVGTGKGYGISWWDVTRKNHNAGNNWLMVHEFNHQLDDIFLQSGYPEYWFNHISPTIGTAARFGEHFDANSYILKIVPPEEWSSLQFTTLSSFDDADMDGIPDKDSTLPLDEIRLGSDSASTDTDHDGVSDFDELKLSNWISEGWGESYGGVQLFPNLHNSDTDNDGIPDGQDSDPCYPNPINIPFAQHKNATPLIHFADPWIESSVWATWDNDSLYFTIKSNRKVTIKFMLDGNNDGWFCGRENYVLQITPRGGDTVISKVQLLNCTDPHRWPFTEDIQANTPSVRTSNAPIDSSYIILIRIPQNKEAGFTMDKNRMIGISIGFQRRDEHEGSSQYIGIFEPNRFGSFSLTK